MVDEIITDAPASTPSEAAPAAPVVTPEVPAIEVVPDAPAAAEVVPEDTKTETPTEPAKPETLLGSDKPIEEKPIEVKTEEKAPEIKTEEAPVEAPKYEIKFPEGVTIDDAKFGEYTKMLGDFETTAKVPHEEVQKLGQQMIERHVEELQRYTKSLTDAWNKQANDWKESFLKSPEFANRTDTVLNSAIDAINVYGGDAKQQQEFRELMESSKVGNHPAMIRLLSNIMLAKAEPKPLAAPMIAAKVGTSKIERMYGKKS